MLKLAIVKNVFPDSNCPTVYYVDGNRKVGARAYCRPENDSHYYLTNIVRFLTPDEAAYYLDHTDNWIGYGMTYYEFNRFKTVVKTASQLIEESFFDETFKERYLKGGKPKEITEIITTNRRAEERDV